MKITDREKVLSVFPLEHSHIKGHKDESVPLRNRVEKPMTEENKVYCSRDYRMRMFQGRVMSAIKC